MRAYKSASRGPMISRILCFVDDCLLVAIAVVKDVGCLKVVVDAYRSLSG